MLKLFISYSHSDEHYVDDFNRHMNLLVENQTLDIWYDRNITAGDDFWDRIEEHLRDRDIVCCFISSYYISSKACKKELSEALELRKKNGTIVIPIILSECAWLDLPEVKRLLAMPQDGKPISKFEDKDSAWHSIYEELKKITAKHILYKDLQFSSSHISFLEDASLLSKAHFNKNELKMSDIYIHPELEKKNNIGQNEKKSFDEIIQDFNYGNKIAIVGDDQSGKTTLAKKAISLLKGKGFIPIYIKDDQEILQGNIENRISKVFKEQYDTEYEYSDFDTKRIIPIIDDFHKAKHREQVLERLASFDQLIIIVDTIFDIDFLHEKSVVDFERYQIKQLKPSLRDELIRKWISVSETGQDDPEFINGEFMKIDERTRAVDTAMGKVFGKNIMPAYPFFILTLLSNYDSINKPLNEEITSQGYCYQALIILFLSKQGVKNDDIDSYINFLTEFAYERYQHKSPLSEQSFNLFLEKYAQDFILENKKDLLKRLFLSGILRRSSLGNYDFNYPYLYYFFAGKFFSEHFDETEGEITTITDEIETILDNLHKNENAYITIFMVHHSKDKKLIEKIVQRADCLFSEYSPATMSKDEMAFFVNDKVQKIELKNNNEPKVARKQALQKKDLIEEEKTSLLIDDEDDEEIDKLSRELRRSIKTVEVLGRIITNRYGSLKTPQLTEIFEKGMNVHLRVMSSFFDVVRNMTSVPNYDSFIKEKLLGNQNIRRENIDDLSQKIFWGINFGFIVNMVKTISISLGTKKIIPISDAVCNKNTTPIKFLIKQDIAMRHSKNIRIDELKDIDKFDMPLVAKNALAFSIVQFCMYNNVTDADREYLRQLGIKKQYLLPKPKRQ